MRRDRYDLAFYMPSLTPLLAGSCPPGGAETQIFLLAGALARQGARVCLVVCEPEDGEMIRPPEGVDLVVRPPYQRDKSWAKKMGEAARIQRTIATIDADALVTRTAGAEVGIAAAAARLTRKAFIYSAANVSDFDLALFSSRSPDHLLYRLGLKLADVVVAQTEEQIGMGRRALGKEPVLIRSIAEPAAVQQHPPEAFLWIGRLVWYKRPLAFVELARSLPDIPFWLVETREDGDTMRSEVAQAAASVPNLELLSPLPRLDLMKRVDRAVAVVNTSDFEGLPNVFLEAWSRGVPALALSHDPNGLIATRGLGEFAHGSLAELAAGAD
ncbi:MAG TPA: glycosyltransferase family 4 protein, partial [Acidimicrobiales bacterium]|nr:glycosyltransferase family 4 protein [Acidimicrobiales bacterium]